MAADAKLLAQIELVGDIDEWIVDAVCDPDCDAYRGPNGGGCSYCIAKYLVDKLTDAGRLLPPGGEVGEEWSARWTPNAEMAAKGYEAEQAPAGSRERAESLARRYGNDEDGTVELLRRRKYVGPWSPVVSDDADG